MNGIGSGESGEQSEDVMVLDGKSVYVTGDSGGDDGDWIIAGATKNVEDCA